MFKINLANKGFCLKGLLMCNLQTILQYWQFSDYRDTDNSHLSFLLTQQLQEWCAEFPDISQTLTWVFQCCSKIQQFLFLLEFLFCQIPFLLTVSPSATGAATEASLELLCQFYSNIPTIASLLLKQFPTLKLPL